MQQFKPKIYRAPHKKSSATARANKRTWFSNWHRARKFANVPTLSLSQEESAIKEFLAQGKGKRYPPAATGNPFFKDDEKCNELLKQMIPIEVDDG